MFTTSSQKENWIFEDETVLSQLREKANERFIRLNADKVKGLKEDERSRYFLNAQEERLLVRYYETKMRDFCRRFQPAMPKSAIATAFHYLKRFYLNNSVMDYHPKEVLVTCVYLACKVDEFNVSIKQFVANVKGDLNKATDIILNNELLLMQRLNYQLTVHNPYRPVEGFLLDLKVRSNLRDPDRLRKSIDESLDRLLLTDAILLYSPSQLALAVILHSASRIQENVDSYVTDTLLGKNGSAHLQNLIDAIRNIRTYLMKNMEMPSKEQVKLVEKRLEICRNEETNPDSELFKIKMQQMFHEEEQLEDQYHAQQMAPTIGASREIERMIQPLN